MNNTLDKCTLCRWQVEMPNPCKDCKDHEYFSPGDIMAYGDDWKKFEERRLEKMKKKAKEYFFGKNEEITYSKFRISYTLSRKQYLLFKDLDIKWSKYLKCWTGKCSLKFIKDFHGKIIK